MSKTENPLISVIIPACNVQKELGRCLDSVCGQTYQNLQILVVDDGSTDRTGEILDAYAKKDGRIVAVHQKNQGVSAARNAGIAKAAGSYLGFVDADDTASVDLYEFLLQNARAFHADISHCGYRKVFGDHEEAYYGTGVRLQQDRHQGLLDLLLGRPVEPGMWNKLYKRSLFQGLKLRTDLSLNEDLLMNYQLFQRAECAIYEDQMKYNYIVRHGSAVMSGPKEENFLDGKKVLQQILSEALVTGDQELICAALRRYIAQLIRIATWYHSKENYIVQARDQAQQELLQYREAIRTNIFQDARLAALGRLALGHPYLYDKIHHIFKKDNR